VELAKRFFYSALNGSFGQRRLDRYVIIAAYLLPICGIVNDSFFTVAAIFYLPIIFYAAFFNWLYLLYPLFFFFYNQLVIGGIVVFRLYTLLFIMRSAFGIAWHLLRREEMGIRFSPTLFASFLLLVALRYALFGGFVQLGAVIDLCFLLLFAAETHGAEGVNRRFSGFAIAFVFAALLSCIVGVFTVHDGGDGRFLATLNDPNYLGFYLNIAILIVYLQPFFKHLWAKLPILAVLYAALIASESITGIIASALVALFCIISAAIYGRFRLKYLIIPMIITIIAVQFVYISQLHDWGMISEFSARVRGKLDALFIGNLSKFTTERSALWRINFEKFLGFDLWEALFGGSFVSAVGRDAVLFPQTSHQEFLDVLLSCGLLGLTVYISAFLFLMAEDAVNLRKNDRELKAVSCIRLGIKLIWLFYALGLTMFLNGRFYVPLLF